MFLPMLWNPAPGGVETARVRKKISTCDFSFFLAFCSRWAMDFAFEALGLALCLFFGSLFQAAPDSIFTFGRIWPALDESPCFGLSGQMRRRSPWAKNQARFLRGSVFAREDQNEGPMGTEFANGAARLGRDGSALSGARGFAVGRARSGLAGWVLPAPCALPLSSPPAPCPSPSLLASPLHY